ncbi:MAG TPA: replication initiation protein [Thiolinea sp.]|nr:replication initiation protein [Thiolinea sp.]
MLHPKVTVSNDLIRAVQRLSLNEKRLLMLAVSSLDENAGIGQLVTVSAAAYSQMYGIPTNNAYRTLKEAESKLWDRELFMLRVDGGVTIRWIISYRYNPGKGSVSLKFHPDLDKHLINLKERFTRYLLSRAADFNYLYSWRLFELVIQFRKTGVLRLSVEEFKAIMEVPSAYDRDFGLVRRKVIDLAVQEIRAKDGLDLHYETTKTGRKITGLTFTFPPEHQNGVSPSIGPSGGRTWRVIDEALIKQEAKPGETWEQARKRLQGSA